MKGTILVSAAVSSLVSITATVVALNALAPAIVEAQENRVRAEQVQVMDSNGTERVNLGTGPGVRSGVTVRAADGTPRIAIGTGGAVAGGGTEPEQAGVFVWGPDGPGSNQVARLGTRSGGGGMDLALGEGQGGRGVLLRTDDDGTRMLMQDANGMARAAVGVDADGSPRIWLRDADGNVTWSTP